MQVIQKLSNDTLYLYLNGEIDECTVTRLRQETDECLDNHSYVKKVVFNLAGVQFMDSTGIGFLIGRYKKIQRYGGKAYIDNPNFGADKVLSVSGVYSLIPKI